jgi:PST family polysaccharide transporter
MTDGAIIGDEGRSPDRTLGEVARNSLGWTFANNVAGRSLTFISSLVLARLLVPREFGVFAIALVVYSLLINLNDIGISTTIVRWPGDIDEVAPTAATLIFLTSLVVYGVFFFVAPYCCRLVGASDATGVTRLLALAIIVDGIFAVPTGMLTRYFRQDRRAIADLVNSVVATVISIVLAVHGYGVWSLAWGRLLGNLVGAILCACFSERRYRPGFKLDAAKKLLRSGTPLLGTTLVTIAVFNVDYLTIGRILGPTALGYYVLAFNVSSWAISIFSFGIDRVSLPTFARLRGNPEVLRLTFIRGMTFLSLATFPVCALMAAMNHPLILFMYGSRWAPSTAALGFLAIFAIVRISQNLAMDTLIAVGNSSSTLKLQSAWLIVLIPSLIVGAHLYGITGVAIAHVIVGFVVVVPIYTIVIRRLGVSVRALLEHLIWPFVGGGLCAVVSRTVAEQFRTPFVALAVGGTCGLAVYLVAVFPTRRLLRSSSGVLDIGHAFPEESRTPASPIAVAGDTGLADPGFATASPMTAMPSARDLMSEVDASPVWFGSPDRLLFGWLHIPDGNMARAGVVLCASLGIESRRAHVAYRILASALARRGFLVLRFDYDGTGDSVGSGKDPDRVSAWTASVRQAVSFLEQTGTTRQVVVGMRVGATIAVNAGIETDLDALVLWDPCVSGRSFIREHQVLLEVINPSGRVSQQGVELPGHVLTAATASDLGSLRLQFPGRDLARRLLVLERPGRPLRPEVRDQLSDQGAEWAEATGQSELLEAISPHDKPPLKAIDTICTWLDRVVDDSRRPVTVVARQRALVGHATDGTSITERVVRLGPLGLVGVMTESDRAADGPVMIMLNDSHEHHVGPARLWVELARRWATLGITSVRVDVSGIGDSPLRPGQKELVVYPPEIFEDVADIVGELRPNDPRDVVLMGVCSGAYHAIECGINLSVRGICAINPALSLSPWNEGRLGRATVPRLVALISSIHPRLGRAVSLAVAQVLPRRSAASSLFLLDSQGTNSLIICGDAEARQLERLVHWDRTRERLSSNGRFRFEHVKGLEHSLLTTGPREVTMSLLTSFVMSLARNDSAAVGVTLASGSNGSWDHSSMPEAAPPLYPPGVYQGETSPQR